MFQKVFGDYARLDPAMIAKVKAAKPGERIFVDRDGDGKNDEVWYIDTNPRHTKGVQPLLVRAIDEDGDLDAHQGPDLDSDLYVVDYRADGTVDVVLDYQDNDHDNDVDEMAFYFYMPRHPFFGEDVLRVWWGRDDGDDNLLWYDIDYNYTQATCQYRCHFSGDESFVAFGLHLDSTEWLSAYENPFLFYDHDKDRCSEEVLRVEGQADKVRSVRWSFDADDDAYGDRTHDYDFSITAVAEDGKPVTLAPDDLASTTLRGLPTQGWLRRDRALRFAGESAWAKVLLTWDEMNANTEQDVKRDPHERWEGVIAHGNKDFPQVGGPPCSTLNKRNEIITRAQDHRAEDGPARLASRAALALYYDPADRKLHLRGASEGWLHVDYDLDGKVDATYRYVDDDGDGLFDRRLIDVDGDGEVDFDWKMNPRRALRVDLEWRKLMPFYKGTLPKVLEESQSFIDAARAAMPEAEADPVAAFFARDLVSWMPQTRLGEYMRTAPGGARLYADLIRDRAMAGLKKKFGANPAWAALEETYSQGNYAMAADMLIKRIATSARLPDTRAFGSFTRRIELRIGNHASRTRINWPVVIRLSQIRKSAADFNPDHCTVVAPGRWLEWRPVPHQVDEVDASVGPELCFMADVPADVGATYYLYYSPADGGPSGQPETGLAGSRSHTGQADTAFPRRTGTAEDWVPPNIGWESQRCAYRAYWGQFDFFGKKTDRLIYDDIGNKSYHDEVEWGIDALHVGGAAGLGGVTLYRGEQEWRAYNPAGEGEVRFVKRQLVKGPVRAAVDFAASNIVPDDPSLTVRMVCIIYAGRQETEIRASVTGGGSEVILAPGLVKLPRENTFADEKAGAFGSWGWQQEVIGDIGMAVIAPPAAVVKMVDAPEDRRMQCRPSSDGRLRWWIIGDWRRGRQHPIAPNIDNWRWEIGRLAGLLNQEAAVTISAPEEIAN
ncbi:MAG: DUF4861 family protein [Planctomycetes bacterium]|nr:DUF4861 family protein [Planctomycetota bacterium]